MLSNRSLADIAREWKRSFTDANGTVAVRLK